jgi:hypothetical protein
MTQSEGEFIPLPLYYMTPTGSIRLERDSSTTIADFNVTVASQENGIINIFLDENDSANLPYRCYYDIQTVDSTNGYVKTWLKGKITSEREVTR